MGIKKTPPAFQLYAANLLSNPNYRKMSLEEVGQLFCLMMECWVSDRVPADLEKLSLWSGKSFIGISKIVMEFFDTEDSEIFSPELDEYKNKLLRTNTKKSEAGKIGMKARWTKNDELEAGNVIKLIKS